MIKAGVTAEYQGIGGGTFKHLLSFILFFGTVYNKFSF